MMMKADVRSKITFYLTDGTSEVEYCPMLPFNCSEFIQNQPYRRRVIEPLEDDTEMVWRVINLEQVVKYTVQAYEFPSPPPEGGTV